MFLLDDFVMITEQQTNLKFLVCLEKSHSEALCMLQQAYNEQTSSHSTVFLWHKRFKEREDIEDDPSTRRNETNVELLKKMVHRDCWLTVLLISDELGLDQNSI